ncbi:hypothetical protein VTG60DRAFT_6507 [Thermothelomyces hinnuleus]
MASVAVSARLRRLLGSHTQHGQSGASRLIMPILPTPQRGLTFRPRLLNESRKINTKPCFLFYMWPVASPLLVCRFGHSQRSFPHFSFSPSASGVTHEEGRVPDVNSCHRASRRTLGQSHTHARRASSSVCSRTTVPAYCKPPQTAVTNLRRHAPASCGRFMER